MYKLGTCPAETLYFQHRAVLSSVLPWAGSVCLWLFPTLWFRDISLHVQKTLINQHTEVLWSVILDNCGHVTSLNV